MPKRTNYGGLIQNAYTSWKLLISTLTDAIQPVEAKNRGKSTLRKKFTSLANHDSHARWKISDGFNEIASTSRKLTEILRDLIQPVIMATTAFESQNSISLACSAFQDSDPRNQIVAGLNKVSSTKRRLLIRTFLDVVQPVVDFWLSESWTINRKTIFGRFGPGGFSTEEEIVAVFAEQFWKKLWIYCFTQEVHW